MAKIKKLLQIKKTIKTRITKNNIHKKWQRRKRKKKKRCKYGNSIMYPEAEQKEKTSFALNAGQELFWQNIKTGKPAANAGLLALISNF